MMKNSLAMKLKILFLGNLLFLLWMTDGCVKQDDFDFQKIAQSEWTPDIAVPLVSSSLSISDLLVMVDSNLISIDNNHLITLVYTGNLYSMYGYQFLPVLDQVSSQSVNLTAPEAALLNLAGPVTKTIPTIYPFATQNGELIDSMSLSQGTLTVSLQSTIPRDGILTISIPSATQSGVPFVKNIPFSILGGMPVQVMDTIDLSGYHLDLHLPGPSNTLPVDYTVAFAAASTGLVNTGQSATVTCNFNALHMSTAYGNFGVQNFNINADSVKITLFKKSHAGTIYIENPSLTFNISNSFGMPLDAHLNTFLAIPETPPNIPITGTIPNPLPINVPASMGQVATSSFTIDNSNSNIRSVFNENIRYIAYNVSASTNLPAPAYNFVSDSSHLKVDVQVNLPLDGYASGFTVLDTIPFKLDSIKELRSASFRLNMTNGFPTQAFVQAYFADSLNNILDSLISSPADLIVESGITNAAGRVIQPTHKMTDIPFDRSRMNNIFLAKKIMLKAVIDTRNAPNQNVKIYSDYKIDMKIGVRAQLITKY